MTTKKRIQANRLNSQKSTGPRSVEGKAVSSQNALKSGIDSESQIIRGEDPAALDALANEYRLDHQPQSASERALVDILIDSEWTLRRLRKTEAHLWEYQFASLALSHKRVHPGEPFPKDQMLGEAFQSTADTFSRLERRRQNLQRAYHRTLLDLREIQESRRGALRAQPDIPAAPPQVRLDPPDPPKSPVEPPPTPSSQKANPEIGFVPENSGHRGIPSRETHQLTLERKKEQPQTAQPAPSASRPPRPLPQAG
ncbi:MAG: hypothetical protein ACLQU1_26165 [Bryobacteraceae bacterium]